jgi:sugar phosphate isomerase/epimerase
MQTTRRQFLKSGLGGALGLTLGRSLGSAAGQAKTIPIAIQLYAVRGAFSRQPPETLKALGQMRYQGVEFWGYAGTPNVFQQYSASQLRHLLDENGLKCCGMHLELKALAKDNLPRTIENNHVLGSQYLNVAAASEKMGSEDAIAELAALLNEAAAQCRPHKMKVGYHAHPFDFTRINGRFAWEILFRRAQPEVNMQMDVGNCLAGHGDPIAMLKEFPGRTWTIHIKEYQDKTFESDFYKEVFRMCETTCATRWYIVEMGSADGNDLEVPRQALAKLRQLGR